MSGYDQQQSMDQSGQMTQPEKKPQTWAEWAKTPTGIIVIIIIILLIIGAGYYWYSNKSKSGADGSELSPTSDAPVNKGGNGLNITRVRGSNYY